MANRFPLILNTSSNQIQELASGDTLDLTGSGLNLTGITTLSSSAELNLQGGTKRARPQELRKNEHFRKGHLYAKVPNMGGGGPSSSDEKH